MVNPGGFIGLRKEFLDSQQAAYDAAMQENDVADVVANIQRRYFKRFPVTLLHTQEPSPEHLAAVDDDAPDPELIPPPQDDENPEAYARARRVYEFQIEELKMRKAQIKRRLQYVHNKSKNSKTSCDLTSVNDPMTVLTSKITGMPLQRPRLRTAYNLWGPHHRAFIDPIFQERVKEGKVPASRQAALRSAIYKELFEKLPKEERDEWANRAEDEHREAMAKVEKALKSEPSSDPTDRQRIINSIPGFVVPILDLIADHTGWKVSLFLGGPEPADGGRLNMVGLHSGVTSGSIKMNYGRSERTFIKDHLYGNFGKFLGKCYSVQECRERILPEGSDLQPIGTLEGIEAYSVDSRPNDIKIRATSTSRKPSGSGSAAASAPSNSTTNTSTSTPPATIKFGPPKGSKTLAQTGRKKAVCAEALPSNAQGKSGLTSRGPSPPPSRPPTPSNTPPVGPVPASPAAPSGGTISSAQPFAPAEPIPRSSAIDIAVNPQALNGAAVPFDLGHGNNADAQVNPIVPITSPPPLPNDFVAPAPYAASVATPSNISDSSAPSLAPAGPATQPVGLETSDITGAAASTPPLAPASHAASVANCPSAAAPTHMPSSDYEQGTSSSAVRSTPESAVAPSPNAADDSSSTTACRSMATATPPAVADATVNDSIGAANSSIPAKDSSNASIPAANSSTSSTGSVAPIRSLPGSVAVPDLQTHSGVSAHKGGQKRKSKGDDSSSAKKRKTGGDSQSASTSNTGSSSTSNGVAGAPAWVSKALALFRSTSLGPEWDELVASWLRFEQTTEYKGVSKLGNQNRPAAVGDWIQRARSPKFHPNIGDLEIYSSNFNAWWRSLQPAWRLDGATDLLRRGEGDWTHLQCSGVNGLLSIVAGLFFWGCEVQLITATSKSKSLKSAKSSKALKSAKSEWMQSLEDVSYVFTQL